MQTHVGKVVSRSLLQLPGAEDAVWPLGSIFVLQNITTVEPSWRRSSSNKNPVWSLTFEIFQKGRLSWKGNGGSCNVSQHFKKRETPYQIGDFHCKSSVHLGPPSAKLRTLANSVISVGRCRLKGHRLALGWRVSGRGSIHSARGV